ncbi:MAG: SAVED domain-containing protein [Cyanobacteriota bacterium]
MEVEYTGDVRDDISRILGGVEELEAVISLLSREQPVSRVTISPLIPGRSGAVVFLVRRLDARGPRKPWVVKAAVSYALVQQERHNYETFVKDRWPQVPALLETGASRILVIDYGGFLQGYEPTTLRGGYARTTPAALATLMQRIVLPLAQVHRFEHDTLPFLEREPLQPSLSEQLATLPSLPGDLVQALEREWHHACVRAAELPRVISTGCHGDLNVGNVLFEPGRAASYPLFIDFGSMHGNPAKGYPHHGHPPFWDFAKLERDIKTRLFLEEATSSGLSFDSILQTIRHLDGPQGHAPLPPQLAMLPAAQRLAATLQALRTAVHHSFSAPDLYQSWYRLSVVFATLLVLYRPADDGIDPALQQRLAAESALALLRADSSGADCSPPPPTTASDPALVVVRSFQHSGPQEAAQPAQLLDLSDLFRNDRDPIDSSVWSQAIPERIQSHLPRIRSLPQPLHLALQTHLSIAWYLGSLLTPKQGFTIAIRQRGSTGESLWACSAPRLPADAARWQVSETSQSQPRDWCGPDLAVCASITRPVRRDAEQAIADLNLPIGRLLHLELPEPSPSAIADGGHAQWLADALIREAGLAVAQMRPPRLHLFLAGPVAFAFLLGQQAQALGPTTVYEFAFNSPSRRYWAGMGS